MSSISDARKRFEAGDRWQIRIECTSGGSSKKWICTGGPGWTTRVQWGPIGGYRSSKSRPSWSFQDAVNAAMDKIFKKDYYEVKGKQPKSILPVVEEVPEHSDAEAQSIMAAVGNLSQTTTTNKNAGGYLSASRRAKIRALWLKKNGKKAVNPSVQSKVSKMVKKMISKEPVDMRFASLELDLDLEPRKPIKTKDEGISLRFALLELD